MHIFISYGRADKEAFARELAAWLRTRGHIPWLDVEHGILPGHPFDVRIEENIQNNEILLAVLSPWSVRPESFCRNEILYAQTLKKTIVPVKMADVIPPIQIISLNCIDAYTRPDELFELLDDALESIGNTGTWQPYAHSTRKRWYESGEELDFQEYIVRFGTGFVGREWLFEELRAWAREPMSRVCLLVAGVGIGKSAIAAQLTATLDVKGVHFCIRSVADSCRPVPWIRSLIHQLARQLPAYREILDRIPEPQWKETEAELSVDRAVSLFREEVSDRLAACRERLQIRDPWVFVIDALDEADPSMVTFLAETIEWIPPWIRLVLTSRPDETILARFRLPDVWQRPIGAGENEHLCDVREFLQQQYRSLVHMGFLPDSPGLLDQIEQRSDGNFQYASVLMKAFRDPILHYRLNAADIGTLPRTLSGLYDLRFRRRFGDVDRDSEAKKRYRDEVRPLLDCLTAAPVPVPESLLVSVAGWEEEVAVEGLRILSQFLIHENGSYRLFHDSVRDWLTENRVGNPFAAYPPKGHRYLADASWQEVFGPGAGPCEYTLRWLPEHLINAGRVQDLALLLADPRFFSSLWRMNDEVARALWVQVERRTSLRMDEVYSSVLQDPCRYTDDFINTLAVLFFKTGHPWDAFSLFGHQRSIATEKGDHELLQRSLGNQASILHARGDLDDAMALLKEQERICRELGTVTGIASSLGNQANILHARGDFDGAMKLLKEQERNCREIGSVDGLWISLGGQALILKDRGDLDGAMALHKEEEQICREIGNVDGLLASLGGQGMIMKLRGDLDGAMTLHKEEERICREIGNVEGLQRSLGNQALILRTRGDLDGAMALLEEQECICHDLGYVEGLRRSLGDRALILKDRGDLDGAMALHKEEEQICRKIGNVDGLRASLGGQALILKARGDRESALALHKEEERVCRDLGNVDGLQRSLGNQALIYVDRLEIDGAWALLEEQERICRELGNIESLVVLRTNQALILVRMGRREEASRIIDEALALATTAGYAALSEQVRGVRSRLGPILG